MAERNANPREHGVSWTKGGFTFRPKAGQTLADAQRAYERAEFHKLDSDAGGDDGFLSKLALGNELLAAQRAK
jgi:hypothetical protein